MKKKVIKKKAAKKVAKKKPSYETLERTIRKLKKEKADQSAGLFSWAQKFFHDLHGYNDHDVVARFIQESFEQMKSQVRLKIAQYQTET